MAFFHVYTRLQLLRIVKMTFFSIMCISGDQMLCKFKKKVNDNAVSIMIIDMF